MANVSIIVPIYNTELYLEECINSILFQTYQDFEIILVDDGSTDNSPIICDNYSKKDGRIVVIHKHNDGQSSARNAGLDWVFKNSKSKFISFLDSDDCLAENFLEKAISYANKEYDIVMCYYSLWNKDHIIHEEKKKSYILDKYSFWSTNIHSIIGNVIWGKIYKKEIFFNLRFQNKKAIEDEYAIPYIISKANKIVIIDEILYFYRKRETSVMSTISYFERSLLYFDCLIERLEYSNKIEPNNQMLNTTIGQIIIKILQLLNSSKDYIERKDTINDMISVFRNQLKTINKSRITIKTKIKIALFNICPSFYLYIIRQ